MCHESRPFCVRKTTFSCSAMYLPAYLPTCMLTSSFFSNCNLCRCANIHEACNSTNKGKELSHMFVAAPKCPCRKELHSFTWLITSKLDHDANGHVGIIHWLRAFRVVTLWCTQKQGQKFGIPTFLSCGVHCRNIAGITEGSTWASPC